MPCLSISSLSCREAMPDKLRFRQPRFNKSHTKGSSLAKLKGVANLKQMVSVQQLGVATHQYYLKLSSTIFQTMAKMCSVFYCKVTEGEMIILLVLPKDS